jgi:hypothetical protein
MAREYLKAYTVKEVAGDDLRASQGRNSKPVTERKQDIFLHLEIPSPSPVSVFNADVVNLIIVHSVSLKCIFSSFSVEGGTMPPRCVIFHVFPPLHSILRFFFMFLPAINGPRCYIPSTHT